MNEGNLRPVAYLVLAALLTICGCSSNQPVTKAPTPPPPSPQQTSPPPPVTQSSETRESPPPATVTPQSTERTPQIAWAKGFEGALIAGLDGALYEPYAITTIEVVQRELTRRGLYDGSANGILDSATMKAIFEFQKATHTLQACGVPTPRTRKMLGQGSHTDLNS